MKYRLVDIHRGVLALDGVGGMEAGVGSKGRL